MYPNPQDVLPLPPRPSLEQYRKRAKDLVKACKTGDDVALQSCVQSWLLGTSPHHANSILVYAREQLGHDCTLSKAQFVIARAHGFMSWPQFVHHIESLTSNTPVSEFEQAADAIIHGDADTLATLLARNPRLVHQRSSREHNATLLHYAAANGVENYRQKTPQNIAAITKQLLAAGANVDAEADMYGGGATTLGLVVTSAHPRAAGVQIELAELLLAHGARVDKETVRNCLANGCPEAAQYFAARGLPMTLEEAAGVGDIELMTRMLDAETPPSHKERTAALMMAAWYNHAEAVRLLLDRGLDPSTLQSGDATALHIAAYQGNEPLVALLLDRGAAVDVRDEQFGTTPMVWALHAWLTENKQGEGYRGVLLRLAAAGADVELRHIDDDRVRADTELFAALSRAVQ